MAGVKKVGGKERSKDRALQPAELKTLLRAPDDDAIDVALAGATLQTRCTSSADHDLLNLCMQLLFRTKPCPRSRLGQQHYASGWDVPVSVLCRG
jgi:hypothetical protein